MENIVYKRDYKEAKAARDKQNRNDIPSQVFDYLITSSALNTMNDAYAEMPRVINDGHKAAYERILNSLDRIANTFGGQIEGVVDYQNWEASIFVVACLISRTILMALPCRNSVPLMARMVFQSLK